MLFRSVPIVTPLVLLLFRKANDFQIALETRGFGAPGNPTVIEDRRFNALDWIMLTIILAVFVAAQYLRILIGAMKEFLFHDGQWCCSGWVDLLQNRSSRAELCSNFK